MQYRSSQLFIASHARAFFLFWEVIPDFLFRNKTRADMHAVWSRDILGASYGVHAWSIGTSESSSHRPLVQVWKDINCEVPERNVVLPSI